MQVTVRAILAGQVQPLSRGEGSAIAKRPVSGRVCLTPLGIAADDQADKLHHGGPDKALHHYPFDHYDRWRVAAPDHPLLDAPGAFGENISTDGLTEDQVCIGDRLRLGSALLEISQGREPCWKQGDRMEWTTLPKMMVREGRSGWYYRVVESGETEAGDVLSLVDRPLPDWTVRRVFGLLIGGENQEDKAALEALVQMPVLFAGWRARAAALIAS